MGKLEKQFWIFHENNPQVYEQLERFALEWRRHRGEKARLGVAMLYERMRWEFAMNLDETPKLSNNHRAFYARLMMEDHPLLAGIFKIKQQKIQTSFGPANVDLEPGGHNNI